MRKLLNHSIELISLNVKHHLKVTMAVLGIYFLLRNSTFWATKKNDSLTRYFRMNPTSPDQFFNFSKPNGNFFRCKVNTDLELHLSSSSEFAQSNDQQNAAYLDTSDMIH